MSQPRFLRLAKHPQISALSRVGAVSQVWPCKVGHYVLHIFTSHRTPVVSWSSVKQVRDLPIARRHRPLLTLLADYQNEATGLCYPRLATMATRLEVSPRHVRRMLGELEQQGIVRRDTRPGRSNIYHLNLTGQPAAPAPRRRRRRADPRQLVLQLPEPPAPPAVPAVEAVCPMSDSPTAGKPEPVCPVSDCPTAGKPAEICGQGGPGSPPHPGLQSPPEPSKSNHLKDSSLRSERQKPALADEGKVNNHQLWKEGVTILWSLAALGETAARRVIGRLLRDMRGDTPAVLTLLRQAETEHPIAPIDWLIGAARCRTSRAEMEDRAFASIYADIDAAQAAQLGVPVEAIARPFRRAVLADLPP
jgi:hypothetical protein